MGEVDPHETPENYFNRISLEMSEWQAPDDIEADHGIGNQREHDGAWLHQSVSPEDEDDHDLEEALRRSREDQGGAVTPVPSTPQHSVTLRLTASFVEPSGTHTARPRTRQARIRELLHHREALCPVDTVRV